MVDTVVYTTWCWVFHVTSGTINLIRLCLSLLAALTFYSRNTFNRVKNRSSYSILTTVQALSNSTKSTKVNSKQKRKEVVTIREKKKKKAHPKKLLHFGTRSSCFFSKKCGEFRQRTKQTRRKGTRIMFSAKSILCEQKAPTYSLKYQISGNRNNDTHKKDKENQKG